MSSAKRVIVDVDVGTDDALALMVLLHAESEGLVKIEAICCSMGNTTVENVCRNVIRILEAARRTDIPVYKGAVEQIIPPEDKIDIFHGSDGFGDLEYDTQPDESIVKSEPAATGMYEIAAKCPGEIFLICLGPLTNVALAMRLYSDFVNLIRGINLMGGSYKAVGNATRTAEYNFYVDPEAAYVVLNSAKCPIVILPWETCIIPDITFEWRFNVLGNVDTPFMQLLNRAERNVYKNGLPGYWCPCDAFLAVAFAYSDGVLKDSAHHATVELHGRHTRGQIILDHLKKQEPNVRIIEMINQEFFKNILLTLFRHTQ